jgi:hypothetical protein
VQQYWIARKWLYPDPARMLACAPWSEDFVNRLVRNDGTLRVRGIMHADAEPVTPRAFIEQPLYHLDLLTSDIARRRDKIVCWEAARPGIRAVGGGRLNEAFYLPELRGALPLRPVTGEDQLAIASTLEQSSLPPRPMAREAQQVSLDEMDRMWEGRSVAADAHHAAIEPHEPSIVLTPSERRHVFFRVHNQGGERWPADLEARPQIRLSYRWLNPDGSVHAPEGPRSGFAREVGPDESILTPLRVDAPPSTGDYVLEVDVVHEEVRWFGCCCRVPVRVEAPNHLPPAGARLQETAPARFRRWRGVRIPRVVHRIWLGGWPLPTQLQQLGTTFPRHDPHWQMRLWTDADLPELEIGAAERRRARSHSELSNLVRYEVLSRHGGVYADTDVECRLPLTALLRGIDAFAALEIPGRVGTAILGSVPRHPVFQRAARLARSTLGTGQDSPDANGPGFLTLIVEQESNIAIFPTRFFYWNRDRALAGLGLEEKKPG